MALFDALGLASPGAVWVALLWLFAMGAVIGSFLNVVIYRLPAGQSLVSPGSRCPRCRRPIRWHDNLPIFGWFILRGRCRDCGASIAARYPAVELTVALIFLLLAYVELVSGGTNLPGDQAIGVGAFPGEYFSNAAIWATYGLHITLMCGLLAMSLIRFDHHKVPLSLMWWVLAICLGFTTIWPAARPVSTSGWFWLPRADAVVWQALLGSILAAVVITLVMQVAGRFWPPPRNGAEALSATMGMAWIAVALGWPAAMALGIVTAAAYLASHLGVSFWPPAARIPWTAWLTGCTLVWICAWRDIIVAIPFWGEQADGFTLLVSALLIVGLTYATRRWASTV